jgi:DNA polymerase I-like protein with 3'-5' exonuclease and polymerase domains
LLFEKAISLTLKPFLPIIPQAKGRAARAAVAHVLGGSVADAHKALLVAVDAEIRAVGRVTFVHGGVVVAVVARGEAESVAARVRQAAVLAVGGAAPMAARLRITQGATMHPAQQWMI